MCAHRLEECVCVSVKDDGLGCLKLDPGASWIHEGPLSCPLSHPVSDLNRPS